MFIKMFAKKIIHSNKLPISNPYSKAYQEMASTAAKMRPIQF